MIGVFFLKNQAANKLILKGEAKDKKYNTRLLVVGKFVAIIQPAPFKKFSRCLMLRLTFHK